MANIDTTLNSYFNETNAIISIIKYILSKKSKIGLGKVVSVNIDEKKVNIMPLSYSTDKSRGEIEQAVIYNIPYFRNQAGKNAIIIDPEVGDIGVYACADRDISRIITTKKGGIPATNRQDSKSDSIYFGSVLGDIPEQYVKFDDSGISIITPNDIIADCDSANIKAKSNVDIDCISVSINASSQCSINAPVINLNGAVSQGAGSYGGEAVFSNNIKAPDVIVNNKSVKDHTHGGVQTGGGSTGGME